RPVLEKMIHAGMNVARLNFSHGEPDYHAALIRRIRDAADSSGQLVAIMGDLPGPKMRIGDLKEAFTLQEGELISLTTDHVMGDRQRVSISFQGLPNAVRRNDTLYLNDGFIQLEVVEIEGNDVICEVKVGGELSSRKGLNLPGIDLGIGAFTSNDQGWLKFAAEHNINALSQSFVASADDLHAVREAAAKLDYKPFIIAKIERSDALQRLDSIIEASDGLMVARGDLGVEIPIETMAVTQKDIMRRANRAGKPVITATQMLESMIEHSRPTRAEATDVANAIIDGTDCVMLSAESAVGRNPVQAVSMLAKIAASTEPSRSNWRLREQLNLALQQRSQQPSSVDLIALSVYHTLEWMTPQAVMVPTISGASARNITRFRLPSWVVALSPDKQTCQVLQFSWGVLPVLVDDDRADWNPYIHDWCTQNGIHDGTVLLVQGPSKEHPGGNHRLELLELDNETDISHKK
ncbi:MAG: pyruvate kinase, partial [gamma proteobacterium symbiont of Bathyaustriella thionipta]|nr:pyruvate kinase [gamma proteobacterium symbiont of Bathyaustriella thionipta]